MGDNSNGSLDMLRNWSLVNIVSILLVVFLSSRLGGSITDPLLQLAQTTMRIGQYSSIFWSSF